MENFKYTIDIKSEIELILIWTKKCVLGDMTGRDAGNNNDPPEIFAPTGLEFQITDTKLYVPVVTLSLEIDKTLLEQLKSGFKRTIKWYKYRSQMPVQNNDNLNYWIHPTFTKANRLFVLSFERIEESNVIRDYRDSFSHYYVPNIEIKGFNVLIDGKGSSNFPIKNEEEAYEKIMDISNNNEYKTDNLLDFVYFKENCRLIVFDLSKETKLKDPQQINFIGKLEGQNSGATIFFIIEKSEEIIF